MAGQGLIMLDISTTPRARLSPELVALCERPEPRQGPEPGLSYCSDEDYQAALKRAAALFGHDSQKDRDELELLQALIDTKMARMCRRT